MLPNGVVYEGVWNSLAKKFSGASAAQSTLLPVLDAFFSVAHPQPVANNFLAEMMDSYMPAEHAAFAREIQQLSATYSIREFIDTLEHQQDKSILTSKYNCCINEITNFRNAHIAIVKQYILAPQRAFRKAKGISIADSAGGKGTGGTGIMSFLKPLRNNTRNKHIEEKQA